MKEISLLSEVLRERPITQRQMKGNQRRRRGLRLKGYDYSRAGAYFVTLCAADRERLFGEIVYGRMAETRSAEIVRRCWEDLPNHYPHVTLDAFVIMPDHVHGIVVLSFRCENDHALVRHGLPEVVRALKTYSARRINAQRGTPGTAVWQRGYYEHIIRDENALKRIRQYIAANPRKWRNDRERGPRRRS